MADAPAPATPAAAPAAKPKAPAAPVAPASTFSDRIARAKAMSPGAAPAPATPAVTATEAPVAERTAESVAETENASEAVDSPGRETENEPLESTGDETDDASETDPGDETPVPGTDAEKLSTGLALMQKGDLDAAIRALGGDPKLIPLPTKRAFRAMARREAKAQARDQAFERAKSTAQNELAAESNRLSQLQRHASQKYGFVEHGTQAWENEEYHEVGKSLERWLKSDLATITQKLASGKAGKAPEEKALADERKKLAAERAEFEATKAKEAGSKTLAQKREQAVTRVGEGLKAHPYIAGVDGKPDPDAIEEVFSAYEKTWNGEKFTKTAKQVADELQTQLEARAKKRGLVKVGASPAPAVGKGGKPVVAARPRIAEPPRTAPRTNLGTAADLDASRAQRVANAKRITEQQRRGVR